MIPHLGGYHRGHIAAEGCRRALPQARDLPVASTASCSTLGAPSPMKTASALMLLLFTLRSGVAVAQSPPPPLKVAIVGLTHGHVGGFLGGGALVPAGALVKRPDAQLVGVIEPDQALFDTYARQFHLAPELHFRSLEELAAQAHPTAVLVFTASSEHARIVEQCAALGIHVMMEKPLAVSYQDACRMQQAAGRGKIHVLVNFETSWYRSVAAVRQLLEGGALGPVVKTVFRDGHQGPKRIGVGPEFLPLLIDPQLTGGSGALSDFGCYGLDLMTSLLHGEEPTSVSALTRQLQPDLYPQVDDEADIVINYPHAVAIVEGSWNWPFSVKQMDVYGRIGSAKTLDADTFTVRREKASETASITADAVPPPYDDPLHYLAAVIRGEVTEESSFSSLKTNVTVSEILDAARQSAQSGRTITLPLAK